MSSFNSPDRATSAVVDQSIDISVQSGIIPAAVAATSATPPIPYVAPMGYSPGFYGQYPAAPAAKPGEAPLYYPQFYIAPMPALPPTHAPGQEGEPTAYPAPQFFPTFITPYAQPYPHTYMLPRPDGQIALAAPAPYAPYPQVYPKHVIAREANGDMPHAQVIDQSGRREMRLENGRMGEGLQQGAHGKST
ncbi:hypothetical protein NLI96_g9741 [Meripilus lineatus]|uniref:DAZ-associated protein 2 n=1 Tax=Meripilus lineatus TaxID=2056292 RepID=A0AAD5UZB3_9APHY|nr:hypothetical protein NLI96_g9741 [Physisporinus lineatus]